MPTHIYPYKYVAKQKDEMKHTGADVGNSLE